MTAVIACLPTWYLAAWLREEASVLDTCYAWMLAVMRAVVRAVLWPVDITWEALMQVATVLYELMAIGSEIAFAVWLLTSSSALHAAMLSVSPRRAWLIAVALIIANHMYCLRTRDRSLRAFALVWDILGYAAYLASAAMHAPIEFGDLVLVLMVLGGIVTMLALRREAAHGRST